MSLMNKRGLFLPLHAIIFIIIIGVIIAAYIMAPADTKILIPIFVVVFIIGVLMVKINTLLSLFVGTLYWLAMEAARALNIMSNPIVTLIFGKEVVISVIAFLIGRVLGRYILTSLGL